MIISNHQSNIDAGLLGASINRDLKFPAKIELFKNPFEFFLKSYGAFPIKRGIVDINSYKNIKKVLENKNGALSFFLKGLEMKESWLKANLVQQKLQNHMTLSLSL